MVKLAGSEEDMKYEVNTKKHYTQLVLEDGYTGTADVIFVKNDGYNVPHYSANIVVPFQNPMNVYLHGCKSLEQAISKAKEHLEYALSRCTLC